jgi:hypothetical protein
MTQKNYFPLDNEHNVLALLRKGYSFIEIGTKIVYKKTGTKDCYEEEEMVFTEAIPLMEPVADKEYVMLSQFLMSAPAMQYHVESSYF